MLAQVAALLAELHTLLPEEEASALLEKSGTAEELAHTLAKAATQNRPHPGKSPQSPVQTPQPTEQASPPPTEPPQPTQPAPHHVVQSQTHEALASVDDLPSLNQALSIEELSVD